MILFELVKCLKDVGFPQEIKLGEFYYRLGGDDLPLFGKYQLKDEFYKMDKRDLRIPTLSELIEACDCVKFMLTRIPHEFYLKYWLATDEHTPGERLGIIGTGSTPEEAVANLYLAINTK